MEGTGDPRHNNQPLQATPCIVESANAMAVTAFNRRWFSAPCGGGFFASRSRRDIPAAALLDKRTRASADSALRRFVQIEPRGDPDLWTWKAGEDGRAASPLPRPSRLVVYRAARAA